MAIRVGYETGGSTSANVKRWAIRGSMEVAASPR